MVSFERDGKVLALNTEEMTYLEFLNLFQPYLDAKELRSIIPDLGKFEISVDDVESTIMPKNKIWSVLTVLVSNGLSMKAVCHWYDTDHIEPCRDLNWLFSTYLKRGISPDDLARSFSGFLSRELLDDKKNVKTLLELGVKADTLVRDVMSREQIAKHFNLLYTNKANVNLVINTLGVFPEFYDLYPVNYLVELGADLLRMSEYIFYPTQPYVDMEKYLGELYHCGLNLTEFVSQVVLVKNLHLYVIVQFPEFFTDRYVDVKSVLKDVCTFRALKTPLKRNLENKLIILANFSKLASLGLIDEPKVVKKDWKWELNRIKRSIFDIVYDSQGYNFRYLLDVDDFKYAEEPKYVEETVSEPMESIIDSEIPDFLKPPKRKRVMIEEVELKVAGHLVRVPEAAPSVLER
ncbi:hypothetical protein J5491_02955 [Candidatus Saccharibacteria bacterium]|nr:hypothetical protein [Candidatus Saccharibacteria bacterium]